MLAAPLFLPFQPAALAMGLNGLLTAARLPWLLPLLRRWLC